MIVLGLDSALDACSAALWRDGNVLAREILPGARGQAENLVPIVVRVLAASGLDWPDLDRIAVTVGPGSFTGLRVGLAAARGFAVATKRPAVGVTTLAALAAGVSGKGPTAVVIDAGRNDVYFQAFDAAHMPLAEPCSCDIGDVARRLPQDARIVGSAAPALRKFLRDRVDLSVLDLPGHCDPAQIAALGARLPLPGDGAMPAPLYIHPPRIKLPGGETGRA